jgi:hypothetical protein
MLRVPRNHPEAVVCSECPVRGTDACGFVYGCPSKHQPTEPEGSDEEEYF